MNQQLFTKKEVLFLLNELLESPDLLIDAIENENTDNGPQELLNYAIDGAKKDELKVGQSIYDDLILISSIDAKTKEGKFCKNIAVMAFKKLARTTIIRKHFILRRITQKLLLYSN